MYGITHLVSRKSTLISCELGDLLKPLLPDKEGKRGVAAAIIDCLLMRCSGFYGLVHSIVICLLISETGRTRFEDFAAGEIKEYGKNCSKY